MMGGYSGYGHMGGYSGMSYFGGLESFGGLIILAVVVLAVIFLVNYLQKSNRSGMVTTNAATESAAVNILNEKFARGEINEDDYKRKKAEILRI